MDSWMWVVMVVLGLALLVGIGILVRRARQRHQTRMETDPAYRYEVERKTLRRGLEKAQRQHRNAVAKAERALKEAHKDAPQASISTVKLTPLTVKIGPNSFPLSQTTVFQLDVDGQVQAVGGHRLGGKRIVAGALLGGGAGMAVGALAQKSTVRREDTREVYLTVRDQTWGDIVKLQPTDIEKAKKFVLAGEIAVNRLPASAEDKQRRISDAEKALTEARADTAAIEEAEAHLAQHEERAPRDGLAG